jgi:hypothetical protein
MIGWDYDRCTNDIYNVQTSIWRKNANQYWYLKGKDGVTTDAIYQELKRYRGQMGEFGTREEDVYTGSVEAFSKSNFRLFL